MGNNSEVFIMHVVCTNCRSTCIDVYVHNNLLIMLVVQNVCIVGVQCLLLRMHLQVTLHVVKRKISVKAFIIKENRTNYVIMNGINKVLYNRAAISSIIY